MKNFLSIVVASILLCLSLPPLDAKVSDGGQGSAISGTGVVSPGKTIRPTDEKLEDKLRVGEVTAAENSRIMSMGFEDNPRDQIVYYVNQLKKRDGPPVLSRGSLYFLNNDLIGEIFADRIFYVLRFPQWPLAFSSPEPLGSNNIFVVATSSDALELITDQNENSLKQFLMKRIPKTKSEIAAKRAMEATLVLLQELKQDGMYKFAVEKDSLNSEQTGNSIQATGKVVVNPIGGNSGNITAKLIFDGTSGGVLDFSYDAQLQPGMRPICQSKKLLDPDPIVRKMAEQDLLIMGRSAKEYLDYQRLHLTPELGQAIDRIWERIIREGR